MVSYREPAGIPNDPVVDCPECGHWMELHPPLTKGCVACGCSRVFETKPKVTAPEDWKPKLCPRCSHMTVMHSINPSLGIGCFMCSLSKGGTTVCAIQSSKEPSAGREGGIRGFFVGPFGEPTAYVLIVLAVVLSAIVILAATYLVLPPSP
jgi:hypothetical protein